MKKNFSKIKFITFLLPFLLLSGCDNVPLEIKCVQDVDGNDWSPPRVLETKCFSNVRKEMHCPIYPELRENHTAYLIDTTDGPSNQFTEKLDILFSNKTEFVNRNKPYTRISIVELNDKQSVVGFEPLGTICRPRTGTISPWKADQAHSSEGALAIQSDFNNKFLSPIQGAKTKLSESIKANRTLIIEHINSLVNQPVYQFTGEDYQNRRLVILSDLLQWSDRFKLVRECKRKPKGCSSFESFYQQTSQNNRSYLDQMKPKLDEYSRVEIHHIQNKAVRDSKIEDQLKNFWIGFFEWAGVPGENIDYYLLPDSQ
jgi:hypothetical protein